VVLSSSPRDVIVELAAVGCGRDAGDLAERDAVDDRQDHEACDTTYALPTNLHELGSPLTELSANPDQRKLARAYGSDQHLLGGAAGNRTRFGVLVSEPNRH
jgi:hypothetical protein